MKEKGGNHLKCCCGPISEVMVKKKKSESQNGALKSKNEKAQEKIEGKIKKQCEE